MPSRASRPVSTNLAKNVSAPPHDKTTDIPPDKEKTKPPTSQSIKFLETLLKFKNEPIDCSKIAIETFLKIKKLNLYLNQPLSKKHLKIYLKNCSQIKTIRTTSCLFEEGVNNRICRQRSCAIKAETH